MESRYRWTRLVRLCPLCIAESLGKLKNTIPKARPDSGDSASIGLGLGLGICIS